MMYDPLYNSPLKNLPLCPSFPPVRAIFLQEPPDDLRKSNFFKFIVGFRGINGEVLDIEKARFEHFINESHDLDLRNGIKYSVFFRFPNGSREQRDLFITLVDAATRKPILYEGQDDSPKMRRVLLTHETICSRCSQQKSCGNKNEAPSDPLIIDKGSLKFFLKCNQNCLKGAGNPKDMRRFSIAISFSDITHDQTDILVMSKKMFVHNNSKHSRKRKMDSNSNSDSLSSSSIKIYEVFPRRGTCGTELVVFGEKFFPGIQLYLGDVQLQVEVVSDRLIHAIVPALKTLTSHIFLRMGIEQFNAGVFQYEFHNQDQIACIHPKTGVRGEEFIILGTNFIMPDLVIICNGVPLETKIMEKVGVVAIIPADMTLGTADIGIYWNNRILFWFRYQIQERNHPEFTQSYGFLTLRSNDPTSSQVHNDSDYNGIRLPPVSSCADFRSSAESSPSSPPSSLSPCKWNTRRLPPTDSSASIYFNNSLDRV